MKVLIVDDERIAREDLRNVLHNAAPGAEVHMAGDPDEAIRLCGEMEFDVAFLDIRMPGRDGLSLAQDLKELLPGLNIVMVTAYQKYAYDAFRLYASDYILKPAMLEDVKRALANLRNPIPSKQKGLYIQCFGNFEVYYDGRLVRFKRAKAKEMLAYMIDREGASSTKAELCAVLWEDNARESEHSGYFAQIVHALRANLKELGCESILTHSRNSYAVVPAMIDCDYYRMLAGDAKAASSYAGEYMAQYSWAEGTKARLHFIHEKEQVK